MIEELKLNLIQWILEIQNLDTLQKLWEQKEEEERKRREKTFLANYGAWQEEEDSDLMEAIYGSRYFEERDIQHIK